MEYLIRVLIPAIRAFVFTLRAGNTGLQASVRRLVAWHRRQMATDPAYPTILAIVAAGILRLTIRNKTQAAMLAALIAKSLGLNPPDYGDGWNPPDTYE